MSQKELNYIEDVINHERLIIEALQCSEIEDDSTYEILQNQISSHEKMVSKFTKLLGGIE